MKNEKPMTDKETILTFLNGLAEYLERKLITPNEFINHCSSAISLGQFLDNIDRIEERLLREQAIDIKNGEYTRFSDPEEFMPPKQKECGYDLDPKNDAALDS